MGRLAQTLGVRLTTMPYFHVLISEESEPNKQRCIFHDLNENSLASNFLKPYKRGKNILSNGEIITLSNLRKIVISQTDSHSEVLLKRFNDEAHKSWEQDLNGSKGYVVLGLPFTYGYDDLANLGKNVTSQFISGAPSQAEKPPVVVAALTNVWVVGIGGAVLAGGIIAWLKWN